MKGGEMERAVSETTSRVTEEEAAALVVKQGRRGDESRMESLTDEEMETDEEDELRERMRKFLRPKSQVEMERRLEDRPTRWKRGSKKQKVVAQDREIHFWNPSARGKVVIGLDLHEVERDIEFLYGGSGASYRTGRGQSSSKASSLTPEPASIEPANPLPPATSAADSSAEDTRTSSGFTPRRRVRSTGSKNIGGLESNNFSMHRSRKGWLVCNMCSAAIWPPNCRKHASICGQT